MNQYITGTVIKELRNRYDMTQMELGEKLGVSAKTISKWETGKGYPDITLLEPIAEVFSVSVTELISGNAVMNSNVSANMLKSHFYICPVCGNIIHSMGESVIQCHGIQLRSEEAEETDEDQRFFWNEWQMSIMFRLSTKCRSNIIFHLLLQFLQTDFRW